MIIYMYIYIYVYYIKWSSHHSKFKFLNSNQVEDRAAIASLGFDRTTNFTCTILIISITTSAVIMNIIAILVMFTTLIILFLLEFPKAQDPGSRDALLRRETKQISICCRNSASTDDTGLGAWTELRPSGFGFRVWHDWVSSHRICCWF